MSRDWTEPQAPEVCALLLSHGYVRETIIVSGEQNSRFDCRRGKVLLWLSLIGSPKNQEVYLMMKLCLLYWKNCLIYWEQWRKSLYHVRFNDICNAINIGRKDLQTQDTEKSHFKTLLSVGFTEDPQKSFNWVFLSLSTRTLNLDLEN